MPKTVKQQPCALRRIIYLMLVILMMLLIFYFSAMQGHDSSSMSGKITEWIIRRVFPGYSDMPADQRLGAFRLMEHIVRKCAHFSEYAFLGAFVTLLFSTFSFKHQKSAAFFLSALYALSDEWHQSFVDGRGPMLPDVLIDSTGAAVGILVVTILILIRRKRIGN